MAIVPLTRWIISTKDNESTPARDAIVNTLYFNVSGSVDPPDFNSLGTDLWALWAQREWATGFFLDIRGYNMSDPEPREPRFIKRQQNGAGGRDGPYQVALCLSYYADRNLPRQRGRIYLGPWASPKRTASGAVANSVIALPPLLAGLGGLNVDWSLWSPTNQTATRINHAWVDDSWDIIRSRKLAATGQRLTWTGNG